MKIKLSFIFIFFAGTILMSQTPTSFMNNGGKFNNKAEGASAFNPWVGAQLLNNFEGTGDFVDNLIVSARVLYEVKTNSTSFKIPVMGNISELKSDLLTDTEKTKEAINKIILGDQGLNFGIYPYYILNDYDDDDFYLIAHGSLGYKLNGFQLDSTTTEYLNSGRISAGLEVGYGLLNEVTGDKPITLSLTPVITFFDKEQYQTIFEENLGSIFSFEITGIIPISSTGVGIMIEKVFANEGNNPIRVGVIFTPSNKNSN